MFPRASRFLYADKGRKNGFHELLALSREKPLPCRWNSVEAKEVPERLLDFDAYRFEVVVNPLVRNRGVPIAVLLKPDAIAEWFSGSCEKWGFACGEPTIGRVWQSRMEKPSGERATVTRASVSGSLVVKNREAFKKSFHSGVGRAKAFGCGLLQLLPLG